MLASAAAAMTALGAPRYAVVVKIEAASGPIRAWSGVGDLEIEADDVDLTGGIYQGIGILGEIPPLRQLIGGLAERLEFNLTAPTGEILALADDDVDDVRSARVNMGVIFFDSHWQMVADPAWLTDGTADVPSVNRTPNGQQIQRSASLSVGSAFTDRTQPALTYYTDADQRRRSPTDRFCERVAGYTGVSTIKWPD